MMNAVVDGFYNSKLKIYAGMWEKGRAIAVFTGVESASYYQLEQISGRQREQIKKWHELFQSYPEKKKFLENYAKPKALAWAQLRETMRSLLKFGIQEISI